MGAKRSSPRTPRQRAKENADVSMRKYLRKHAQYERARDEMQRLLEESEDLKAEADFLNSHPLLNDSGTEKD